MEVTASNMIRSDRSAFRRVIGTLRVSGLDVQTWHTMLARCDVIKAIANGSLPKMIRNLNIDGCSQHEWHTRINSGLVRLCTLRCTCTPPTCVCRCHNAVASAADKKKQVACVCECRTRTQSVSVAGLQEEMLNQTTDNPVYAALVMLREVAGLPPPPPPPLIATLQGTLFDSTRTHVHTT